MAPAATRQAGVGRAGQRLRSTAFLAPAAARPRRLASRCPSRSWLTCWSELFIAFVRQGGIVARPMPTKTRSVRPGPSDRTVLAEDGAKLPVPVEWALLPPGDAGLTRRVKAAGPTWTVQEKVGRRTFSRGVWAPAEHVERSRAALAQERADPAYAKKLEASRALRERKQEAYVEDFQGAVLRFLDFDPMHRALAERLAGAVTTHATPVGSGTVARTERIPLEERVQAAVIAWMRHQTTAYDDMTIPRVRGERRRVRRMLAERSNLLLDAYRRGERLDVGRCPLQRALDKSA